MLVIVAVTVIMSFQTVGTLLVFGMLLAPAGPARSSRAGSRDDGWAVLLGTISAYLGLLLSYHFDPAAGATIVARGRTVVFFVS